MQHILLQVADEVDINTILSILEPFGKTITVESSSCRSRNDSMDWLGRIYQVDEFKPLKREALYDRYYFH